MSHTIVLNGVISSNKDGHHIHSNKHNKDAATNVTKTVVRNLPDANNKSQKRQMDSIRQTDRAATSMLIGYSYHNLSKKTSPKSSNALANQSKI
jgi:hypothetical protein